MKREHKLSLAQSAGFAIYRHLGNLDRLHALTSSVPFGEPRHRHFEQILDEQSRIRKYMAAQMDLGLSVEELAMLTEIVGEELDGMSPNREKEIPLATDFMLVEKVAGEKFAIEYDEAIGRINLTRLLDGKKPFFQEDDGFVAGIGRADGNVIYPDVFHRRAA